MEEEERRVFVELVLRATGAEVLDAVDELEEVEADGGELVVFPGTEVGEETA